MYVIEKTLEIKAPAAVVWEVITDVDKCRSPGVIRGIETNEGKPPDFVRATARWGGQSAACPHECGISTRGLKPTLRGCVT